MKSTDFGGTDFATSIVLQPDGKIVLSGGAYGSSADFALARYNTDGTLDATFSDLDTTPPTVTSFSPADAATGVAVGRNIEVTFSESIQKGTGIIAIHSGSATGTVVESYNAALSTNLSISGNTLTINPTSNLASNTQYYVTFAASHDCFFFGIANARANHFCSLKIHWYYHVPTFLLNIFSIHLALLL